jgi:pimeloyl-ACP methyl ester carboxylesterase
MEEGMIHRFHRFSQILAVTLVGGSHLATAQDSSPTPRPLPENVEMFTVRTRSEQNRQVPFYLRIPGSYDPANRKRVHRLLYICPTYNGDAELVIRGEKGNEALINLAEERGWFVLSGTFKQQGGEVRDRKASYYYPEGFSGRAVVEALEQVAKKYPVDPNRILMQGLSGGAQFVHRFAIWAPDRVTAVAINSCSWFDAPNAKCNQVAWLVTIGESDPSFANTLEFVDQLREVGAAPLFRSYLGMVHEGSEAVTRLNLAFLRFYDEHTRHELGQRRSSLTRPEELLAMKAEAMPFVGDSQDWKYAPNTEENRENIAEDSRIFLPSEEIARLWGQEETGE